MRPRVHTADLDWLLLALVGVLCCLGLLEVYSATRHGAMAGMVWRQLGWVGLGFAVLWVISRLDYQLVLDRAPVLYMLILGALVAVLLVRGLAAIVASRAPERPARVVLLFTSEAADAGPRGDVGGRRCM